MIITDKAILSRVSETILPQEVESLKKNLESELRRSARLGRPGIGLAAPQIGILKRMAIVRVPISDGSQIAVDLINPIITAHYDRFLFKGEGCLSFPGKYIDRERFNEIVVETHEVTNNEFQSRRYILTGLVAVAAQHEIDHLDGILID